jgi:CheY-like chemotaxis protein
MSGPILIVDDDPGSLGWVVEALRSEGYETLTASNGAEALRTFASAARTPNVVLLDLMMPVMDGWDVIASFVRHPARPNVIVMSAYCKDGGVPAGAVALLQKPLRIEEVLDVVHSWCGAPSAHVAAAGELPTSDQQS